MFDTKSSQIPRTFLWLFSQTFGLDYSPLNSAMLSCSSEVTLPSIHVCMHYLIVRMTSDWSLLKASLILILWEVFCRFSISIKNASPRIFARYSEFGFQIGCRPQIHEKKMLSHLTSSLTCNIPRGFR